jgi:hypothetical protein
MFARILKQPPSADDKEGVPGDLWRLSTYLGAFITGYHIRKDSPRVVEVTLDFTKKDTVNIEDVMKDVNACILTWLLDLIMDPNAHPGGKLAGDHYPYGSILQLGEDIFLEAWPMCTPEVTDVERKLMKVSFAFTSRARIVQAIQEDLHEGELFYHPV